LRKPSDSLAKRWFNLDSTHTDPKGEITLKAFCVFSYQGAILVYERFDYVKKQGFYRPLGGKVEFGEYSAETLRRELMEETSMVAEEIRLLGVLENIFVYNGKQQHEVDFVYDGVFTDKSIYSRGYLEFVEGKAKMTAKWMPIKEFTEEKHILYPAGLLQLLIEKGYD
jgi:8-oxo-dGTP pyrophosphatase MutT (NUDIX family)